MVYTAERGRHWTLDGEVAVQIFSFLISGLVDSSVYSPPGDIYENPRSWSGPI